MSDDTTHPYPEREYPPVSPAYRAALVLAAQRAHIAVVEARRRADRERCHTADDEGRAA